MSKHKNFMKMAVDLSLVGMNNNEGGPFGAILVKEGEIVGKGNIRFYKAQV